MKCPHPKKHQNPSKLTAARVVFGMNVKVPVKSPKASSTTMAVKTPPNCVFTPELWLIAVRENEPVMGMDWKKDDAMLHRPSAIISCVASTILPLLKAFAIATDSRIDTSGSVIRESPSAFAISRN